MTELSAPVFVRAATVDDVGAITEIQMGALVDTVAHVVGQQYRNQVAGQLSQLDIEATWNSTIALGDEQKRGVLVATDSGEVVGFAAFAVSEGEAEAESVVPGLPFEVPTSSAQILVFEVAPSHRRIGHGSRLLAAIADILRPQGVPGMVVWIVGEDQDRVRFFRKAGFAPVGVRRGADTGVGEVVEHLWFAALD
ncbi:GNAT family N-acetyltransferase [Actinomyces minihominis]|uniref:GNAT family N-acetyltransferase n=1 Tax=Actinomyces minihominis TaxID=2002838 RepID=UPI001A93888B|nr:GNAT family N-acetyltransferase [Actinomyces minihominis]